MITSVFQLLKHVTISSGGVLPHIHPELLTRRKGPKFQNVLPKPVATVAPTKAAKKAPPTPPSPTTKVKVGKATKIPRPPKVQKLEVSNVVNLKKNYQCY